MTKLRLITDCLDCIQIQNALTVFQRIIRGVFSAAESWDRRENNLKKRCHLLTAAELKRRGITRYDAEMLLSQGFSLPEPKSAVNSPSAKKSRLKSSTPVRCSPRTHSRLPLSSASTNQVATPTSAGVLRKSVEKRSVFIGRAVKRPISRSLRSRVTNRQLAFCDKPSLLSEHSPGVTTRHGAKQAANDADLDPDPADSGDVDEDDSSLESCSSDPRESSGRRNTNVDIALSMSCDTIDSDCSPWKVVSHIEAFLSIN